MNHLSHGQDIVLRHNLANYPEFATFQEVLQLIEEEDERVTIWCNFDDWDKEELIRHLDSLAMAIDKAVVFERDKL